MKVTMLNLRNAKRLGRMQLTKSSMFYQRRSSDSGRLRGQTIIVEAGRVVEVEKLYRRGRAALLKHTDAGGTVWWSWTHATEFEPVRQYRRKNAS